MLDGDGWSLGSFQGPDDVHELRLARPLTPDECARIPTALARLREFSGQALMGPVVDSLNDIEDVFGDLPSVSQREFHQGAFRSRLNGRMSAALTAFTGLRATVERTARGLELPMPSSAPANFHALYRDHPSYRLVWMLRNLDQHRPPAASTITISAYEDSLTGASRVRPVIDVGAVCARCAAESSQANHRRQWEECASLWVDQSEPVDIRAVFKSAFSAAEFAVAAYMREAEYLILDDARFIANLVGEIEPVGSASALRVVEKEDRSNLSVDIVHLDPMAFGEAIASLNAARTILGQPPIPESEYGEQAPST